jgi:hypothetical protein
MVMTVIWMRRSAKSTFLHQIASLGVDIAIRHAGLIHQDGRSPHLTAA